MRTQSRYKMHGMAMCKQGLMHYLSVVYCVLCFSHVTFTFTCINLHAYNWGRIQSKSMLMCLWCLQLIKQFLWSKLHAIAPFHRVHVAIHWPRKSPSKSAVAAVWERPGARPVRGAHYLTQVRHFHDFQKFLPWQFFCRLNKKYANVFSS